MKTYLIPKLFWVIHKQRPQCTANNQALKTTILLVNEVSSNDFFSQICSDKDKKDSNLTAKNFGKYKMTGFLRIYQL